MEKKRIRPWEKYPEHEARRPKPEKPVTARPEGTRIPQSEGCFRRLPTEEEER